MLLDTIRSFLASIVARLDKFDDFSLTVCVSVDRSSSSKFSAY